jgi:xanthine dehydrogenase accessory factor
MFEWIDQAQNALARGEATVLVTVVKAEGSTPREPGAKMLVGAWQQWQTIGGGHLEWRAMAIARTMLQRRVRARHIERLSLGPSLGQCCGGVATLAFELLTAEDADWIESLRSRLRNGDASVRTVLFPASVAAGAALPDVTLGDPEAACETPGQMPRRGRRGNALPPVCALWQAGDQRGVTEVIAPPDFHIVLFGAGHVGRALVNILGALPCKVTWVDERDTQFPDAVPANVTIEDTDTPEVIIEQAPAGTYFVVMTHNHALDQHLCQHIFLRDDFAWFGLIGSRTKRRKFEHRLRDRGVPAERLQEMVCPIGVPGITSKEPAAIAVAVAAQLLALHEQKEKAQWAADTPARSPAMR